MGKHFLFLLLIATVLVSGCVSYGGQTSQQPSANQSPSSNAVTIQNFAFSPATLTVKAGTTVTWTNQDSATHTVTSDSGAFDSGQLSNGGSFSQTFNTAGTFDYRCNNHPLMTAKIIVE
ncbi:MAG: cupredoxin family copper-binding protein [Candidatus Aenigmatarchaeota archaeon]